MIAAPLQKAPCLFLAEENHARTGSACLAVVEAKNLVKLAKDFLAAGYHLEDVSGLDTADGAVSVYHFDHFDSPCRATVLVIAPHGAASFPSIASVYEGAEWHERETRDFYGFNYEGNPNLIPLLMPENMDDVHPLAKEEGARASLAAIFSAQGRERTIVKKADGFSLLDVPVKEEPAPVAEEKPAAAPKPEAKPEPKAEPKAAAPVAEKAATEPAPEKTPVKEEAPASKPEPKPEPKAAAPVAKKAETEPRKAEEKPKADTGKNAPPAKKSVKPAPGKKGGRNA